AARESARRSQCSNNLKQIGDGLQNYLAAKNTFPAGNTQTCYACDPWNWTALILDFMEEASLAAQLKMKQQPTAPPNDMADGSGPTNKVVSLFLCPSTGRLAPYRLPEARMGDFVANGKFDLGEGMGCSDYGGIDGPNDNVVNYFKTAKSGVGNEVYGKN